jgi:hypothetical protein
MDLRCTCGAFPPGDAQFCHKCGRPLRESSSETASGTPDLMAVVPPPVPVTPAAQAAPEIGFSDSLALRVCLLAASIAAFAYPLLVSLLPGPLGGFGAIALLGSSGVLAVLLYRRRSGAPVSVLGGARLGWITGVFCFVILLVFATITVLLTDENAFRAAMAQNPDKFSEELRENVNRMLKNPEQAIAWVTFSALVMFVTMSMMASVGGALGAKYFGQRQQG